MKPFTLFYFSSFALVFSKSVENTHHSQHKRSASPQLTVNADPNALVLGAVVAGVGGLALNHAAGDPLGKHLGNLFNRKPKNQFSGNRPPTNVEHHHHHYIPEYDTQEAAYWSQWAQWQSSVCSKSCGTGTMNQQRTRHCSQGSNACVGHADEAKQISCNSQECPVDGFWQAYSEWKDDSVCSRSCGGGTRLLSRHRQCVGPYGGGHPCIGSSEDTKSIPCNSQACPTDGVYGPWKELSTRQSCRVTCGPGTVSQVKERTCIGPYNGGRPCIGQSYIESCVEDRTSHNTGGQYTAVPKPSYGVGNGAISPRTLGDRALNDNSDVSNGEVEKPVYTSPRQHRAIKYKGTDLPIYDGILTPYSPPANDNGDASKAIRKPVYGPAERY
jgi:hypothetical protein